MNYDRGQIISVPVLPPLSSTSRTTTGGGGSQSNANQTNTLTIQRLGEFLTEFQTEGFMYRDRLRSNVLRKEWTLSVEMGDLIAWDSTLGARMRSEPNELIPLVSSPSLFLFLLGGADGGSSKSR